VSPQRASSPFAALAGRWQAMSPRERRLVVVASLVLTVGLVWGLLIDPAMRGRARLATELPALRAQLGQMEALSAEAKRLGGAGGAKLTAAQVREELERSAGVAGLRANLAKTQAEAGRIEMQFVDAPFAAWLGWLDGVQRTLRLRVLQVSVARANAPAGPGGAGGPSGAPPGSTPVVLGQPPAGAARPRGRRRGRQRPRARHGQLRARARRRRQVNAARLSRLSRVPRLPVPAWQLVVAIVLGVLATVLVAPPAVWADLAVSRASGGRLRLAQAEGTLWSGRGRVGAGRSGGCRRRSGRARRRRDPRARCSGSSRRCRCWSACWTRRSRSTACASRCACPARCRGARQRRRVVAAGGAARPHGLAVEHGAADRRARAVVGAFHRCAAPVSRAARRSSCATSPRRCRRSSRWARTARRSTARRAAPRWS
jgi:general secretion pathway protein M